MGESIVVLKAGDWEFSIDCDENFNSLVISVGTGFNSGSSANVEIATSLNRLKEMRDNITEAIEGIKTKQLSGWFKGDPRDYSFPIGQTFLLRFSEGDMFVVAKTVNYDGAVELEDVENHGHVSDRPQDFAVLPDIH